MTVRKYAKYFTRTDVKDLLKQAFIAGQHQGMKDGNSVYWSGWLEQDTDLAFAEWLNQQDVVTLKTSQ